jgi:hypothetical protein
VTVRLVDEFHRANVRHHLNRIGEALDRMRADLPDDEILADLETTRMQMFEWIDYVGGPRRPPNPAMEEARQRRLRQRAIAAGRDDGGTPARRLCIGDVILNYPTCDEWDPDTGHEDVTGEIRAIKRAGAEGIEVVLDTVRGSRSLILGRDERVLLEQMR